MNPREQMRGFISSFPDLWNEAWEISRVVEIEPARADKALFCGMGGSSIGGALTQALAYSTSTIPIQLGRDYHIPAWADTTTLSVFTSYSGNTAETLSAYKEAGITGTKRFCISSGGEMLQLAAADQVPFIQIPPGLPPRAALPYTLVPLLHVARCNGLVTFTDAEVGETGDRLAQMTRVLGERGNQADDVAHRIARRIPIVYSGPGLLSAANLRWRGQLQENAKSPAFGNLYPELNHNEIEGWDSESELLAHLVVLELADPDDLDEVRTRMDVTRRLLRPKAADWIRLEATGTSRLERLLSMVLMGDWVSYYLAEVYKADALAVPLIDALKAELAAAE